MELSAGEVIELSFRLPGRNLMITLEGLVRRAGRVGEGLRAGVEFKWLPEGFAEALQAFWALPLPAP